MKPINLRRVSTSLALLLATLATLSARAQITWGAAQNITDNSDVVTAGTLLYAYDYANSSQVVNGVTFAGANSANAGGNVGTTFTSFNTTAFTSPFAPFALLPTEYQAILVGAAYVSSASTYTVTCSNLVSGRSYLVQFWVNDPRSATASRTDTLSSPGGNSVLLRFAQLGVGGNPGQFAVGLFTASGTTQTLTVVGTSGSVPSMNAVQVRDVTGLNLWGGYQNGTWDYTSTNWGTGQSFASLNHVPVVNFADTNALGAVITASAVTVQPAGVSLAASVNFVNNSVNYTLQSNMGDQGINGATAVNKLGSGTVTFTGPNTYTGVTTISGGTLALSGSGSITTSTAINLNGGTLDARAAGSFYLGSSQPVTLAGGVFKADSLTLDGAVLSFALSASHPSITTSTLIYNASSSLTVLPPRFSSYPAQFPLIAYTSIGGGSFNLNLQPLPYGFAGYLSNNIANNSIDLVLTSGLVSGSSAYLNWDPAGSLGSSDGSGIWSSATTNWWNGVQTVPWNNSSNSVAIFGFNTASAYTATITNTATVGGVVFANAGVGAYTIAGNGTTTITANSNLVFSGTSPVVTTASGTNAVQLFSATVSSTNGLSVVPVNGGFVRFGNISNNIVGNLYVGRPGTATYDWTNTLFCDFNTPTATDTYLTIVNNLTNVTVYSNATFRISGHNSGSRTTIQWPKQITISGDGYNNASQGAWTVTGNVGDNFIANVVLAGDSTIAFNAGGTTFGILGPVTGNGRLQLVCTGTTKQTAEFTNASTYSGDTIIAGGLNVALISGDNRLPTGTVLTLGTTATTVTEWNKLGKLTLGNSTLPVNQTIAGLQTAGVAGCAVAGGNSATNSILTVNAATDYVYAGTLGGAASPANSLALVKSGGGKLSLQGTNQCLGGYTVTAGTLEIGDGGTDNPFSGPITNNAAVSFNTASSSTYADILTGSGTVTKNSFGWLTLAGANNYTGPTIVSAGKLTLSSSQTGAGALSVKNPGAELEIVLTTAGSSLTNSGVSFNNAILDFNFNQGVPGGAIAPLTVTGGLTNSGTTTINLVGYSSLAVGTLPLIHYGSYQSNALSSFSLAPVLGTGGTAFLTNDTVNKNISVVVPRFDGFVWTGATDTNWDTTTPNWADITTLVPNTYALGGFARFYDSGKNTAIQVTSDPQPSSIIVSNNVKAYSFNGAGIGGVAALIKQGPGTLTVAVNNNNTGGTIIQQGTLQVGDGTYDGTITTPITDNGTVVYNVLAADTASGISGAGTLTKTGPGQLNLGGGSTYTGATTVQQGQLHVTDSAALGATNSGTTVQPGSGLWVDAAGVNIPEALTLSGTGVFGEGVLVANYPGASTWSGPMKVVGDSLLTANSGAALTIAGTLVNTNSLGATNNLLFSVANTGYILVSNAFSAASVVLTNNPANCGGLILAGANPSLKNLQVLNAVPASSSPPTTSGLWAINSQAFGTNSIVTLTNSDTIGNTGTRLGLDNNVTIPAGVSLQAYCPGNGVGGVGGYRCTLGVLTSTTNTWNGPITLHGADPALGVTSIFILIGGNSGTTARLVVNGNVTVADGVVTLLPRGWSSGQFNGQLNLGTNTFSSTDGARWTVASTGNTWGLTQIGSSSSTLALGTNNALCISAPFDFLAAGTWDLNGFNQQVAGLYDLGGTVVNTATNAASTLTVSGVNTWTFGGTLVQSGVAGAKSLGLTLTNGANLTLTAGNNTYTGPTVIANGATLALSGNGNITASSIKVQAGGTLNASARTDGTFTSSSTQVLSGNGTINGSLANNGTLSPGESIGKLTVNANVTLGSAGSTVMEVNNATITNDLLTVGGTLTCNGMLLITNVSGTLYTNNQVLKLFNATGGYAGAFTNIVFPGVTSYDATQLTVNGTIKVVSVVPTTPTNITVSVSGGNMTLAWPANYTGWRLQAQTNALTTGLNTNWANVAGTSTTNQVILPIVPGNPTVFYRLVYP